jgi:hypothetical protein
MSISMKTLIETFEVKPNATGPNRVKTPKFRSTFAFVFEPRETPNGELKYSTGMIFSKDDLAILRPVAQAIVDVTAKKFGIDWKKWPKNLKCPIGDGDEERDGKEWENSWFLNAGSKSKPGIVDRNLDPIIDREEFYSGCFARASLTFYAYDTSGNKGVGTGLNNLIKWEDGDRLDGSTSAEDDFKDLA